LNQPVSNTYEVKGDIAYVHISSPIHSGTVIVDADQLPLVKQFLWFICEASKKDKFYVRRVAQHDRMYLTHLLIKTKRQLRFADGNPLNCRTSNLITLGR
jgi:hypothetical protein